MPAARMVAVEYPGYVRSKERVLQTLGGLEGVARQLQDNAEALPLRYRCAGMRGAGGWQRAGASKSRHARCPCGSRRAASQGC